MVKKMRVFLFSVFIGATVAAVNGQTTTFVYQGSLQASGVPASGNYDFEFVLFDALANGTQLGTPISSSSINITNGVFSVSLDFGSQFTGPDRFLEIRVRATGAGAFTTLIPRQPVTSSPYSIRSLNAGIAATANSLAPSCVGCVTAAQIGSVNGSAVTGAIPVSSVPPGSANYVQNSTVQQNASNFNVSGSGSANLLNSRTQYNLNGERILTNSGSENLFAGVGAGESVGSGSSNAFFGFQSGQATISGQDNSFFGARAGASNTFGNGNSFFGKGAGPVNSGGGYNSFFGYSSGQANTNGQYNSFFGTFAGQSNTTGNDNSFFGHYAGRFSTGSQNTLIGQNAGWGNSSGGQNTALGYMTNLGSDVTYATVIGAGASNSTNNSIQLGRFGLDYVRVGFFPPGGSIPVCTSGNALTSCVSSRRFKDNIVAFGGGLEIVKRFRPVTFDWKDSKVTDLGLIAEEVAEIEPLLVTRNLKGEIEGVKYDQLNVVLINAIKEQQNQIDLQKSENERLGRAVEAQKREIDALKALFCEMNKAATVCRKR